MLDHIILTVSDVERSLKFYTAALKPLKIKMFLPYRRRASGKGVRRTMNSSAKRLNHPSSLSEDERRERRCANAECESRRVAARRVGRSRALANGTRGTESDSSHAPGSGNSHAISSDAQN